MFSFNGMRAGESSSAEKSLLNPMWAKVKHFNSLIQYTADSCLTDGEHRKKCLGNKSIRRVIILRGWNGILVHWEKVFTGPDEFFKS